VLDRRVTRVTVLGALAGLAFAPLVGWSEETVRLHAAGSLRGALTEVAEAFSRAYSITVKTEFGASGLLRERLEQGEAGDVFASANMEHPHLLARQGKAGPVVLFARNELCALARGGLSVTSASLLERMLDPAIKLGTSTPKADPSGDYAWEVFRKADGLSPGAREALEKKALQLTGGPTSPRPPGNRGVYAWVMEEGQADLFLTYCTNARSTAGRVAGLQVITLPPALAVGADYGLTVLASARSDKALKLAMFILSPEGQEILARHGFTAPTRPAP
jgi:molybdate transport system substrate-binding protein